MVYDEGFEVNLDRHDMSFFAFFEYKRKTGHHWSAKPRDYISYCHKTRVGWVRTAQSRVLNGCFKGHRMRKSGSLIDSLSLAYETPKKGSLHHLGFSTKLSHSNDDEIFHGDYDLIKMVNNDKSATWKAAVHKQFIGKTMRELSTLLGRHDYSPTFPAKEKEHMHKSFLETSSSSSEIDWKVYPRQLDWRNVGGVNFMNGVWNQKYCGSCYAVSSTDVFATRFNIQRHLKKMKKHKILLEASNITSGLAVKKLVFSPQDVLSCSDQNQGCQGGYPYLVAKYGSEEGFTSEKCMSYTARDRKKCSSEKSKCPRAARYRIKKYKYVGGFYGACNEKEMIKELQSGPIILAFEAQRSLFSYRSGVYSCSKKTPQQKQQGEKHVHPWQKTTHAVVGVGYGEQKIKGKKIPYWIVKNSWGHRWGDKGYFKILRGCNSCAIESMAVSGLPKL